MAFLRDHFPMAIRAALVASLAAFLSRWHWFRIFRFGSFVPLPHFKAAHISEGGELSAADCSSSRESQADPHVEFTHDERIAQLAANLMSPRVRVPVPAEVAEVPARLSDDEVAKVFVDNVPGVQGFLFRQKRGMYSLKFLVSCYRDGFSAFRGTALHEHLLSLLRLVVHHGEAGGAKAAEHLREVAESFQDCQAVQARVVERAGLEILGVAADFPGLLARLAGEYKTLAVQMLAAQHVSERGLREDPVPTHYANRLTADLGEALGLNSDDVRRAELDRLATERFAPLGEPELPEAVARCRGLFDVDAMLSAFVAEVNGFGASSTPESLPRLFLTWASECVVEKHAVLDESTCTRVEVTPAFALAVFEVVFLAQSCASASEYYRGHQLRALFIGR